MRKGQTVKRTEWKKQLWDEDREDSDSSRGCPTSLLVSLLSCGNVSLSPRSWPCHPRCPVVRLPDIIPGPQRGKCKDRCSDLNQHSLGAWSEECCCFHCPFFLCPWPLPLFFTWQSNMPQRGLLGTKGLAEKWKALSWSKPWKYPTTKEMIWNSCRAVCGPIAQELSILICVLQDVSCNSVT